MCDQSRWTGQVYCGPMGTCVNSTCVCQPGWKADLSMFKQRNCWLPELAMDIVDGVVGIASLIVFLLAVRESFRARAHAKTFMLLTATSMLFAAGFCLAHHLEGGSFGPAAIILLNLAIRFASDGIALALYHMLKSFWKMAGKGKVFRRAVIICQVLEFISLGAASVAMIVLLHDDFQFSIAMTVFFLLFSLHFAGLLAFLLITTSSVIKTVQKANGGAPVPDRKKSIWESIGMASPNKSNLGVDGNVPSSSNTNTRTSNLDGTAGLASPRSEFAKARQESFTASARADNRGKALVDKVKRYRKFGKWVGPIVIVGIWVMCILEYTMGSVPLLWTILGVSILHFPLIGMVQLLLVKTGSSTSSGQSSDPANQQLLPAAASSPSPTAASARANSIIF